MKTKAIRYFQTDRTLTRIVSPPLLDTNFPENLQQKGLLWTTNILDMKGYDYDTQMLQGNYTGIDKLLVKNVNMIQTDYPQVLASYLESKGRR